MQEIQEKGQMRVKIQTAEVDREVSNERVHVRQSQKKQKLSG